MNKPFTSLRARHNILIDENRCGKFGNGILKTNKNRQSLFGGCMISRFNLARSDLYTASTNKKHVFLPEDSSKTKRLDRVATDGVTEEPSLINPLSIHNVFSLWGRR